MNRLLYPKLAWQSLRQNFRFWLPYLLSIIGCSGAFYILLAMAAAPDLPDRTRYAYLSVFTGIGAFVVALFSFIFLFYTNSFLMKRRTKELGLYNVLGLGKRHIARILGFEMFYTALMGIGGGLVFGMLFQKLVTLLLFHAMKFEVYYGFYVSGFGMAATAEVFGAILTLCLLWNLVCIRRQNPVEMLRFENAGEKEPRARFVFTLLGIVCLGAGYFIAIVTDDAMQALTLYSVAVILVIAGTYCLFTSVSIALLKMLRKNKNYYYQTKHFIGISGMLYRMKRNAVGLANICILSTMVLVMVSGTTALFLGTEDSILERYPTDIAAAVYYYPEQQPPFDPQAMYRQTLQRVQEHGVQVEQEYTVTTLSFDAGRKGELFTTKKDKKLSAVSFTFLTAQEYKKLTGEELSLARDEVVVWGKESLPQEDTLTFDFSGERADPGPGMSFRVVRGEKLSDFSVPGVVGSVWSDCYCVAVADDTVIDSLYRAQSAAYGDLASRMLFKVMLNIAGDEQAEIECAEFLRDVSGEQFAEWGSWQSFSVDSRAEGLDDFYTLNGGFFFLGVFLGLLFVMATVLIIYYKQISEGYEDVRRFQIMQQVGLEKKEIERFVKGQVRVVFFMPLLAAVVHVAFDFGLVTLLLTLFGLYNTKITLLCTVGTVAAFAVIYAGIYLLTAKIYYRIVSQTSD